MEEVEEELFLLFPRGMVFEFNIVVIHMLVIKQYK
jgi:hypothetical protein